MASPCTAVPTPNVISLSRSTLSAMTDRAQPASNGEAASPTQQTAVGGGSASGALPPATHALLRPSIVIPFVFVALVWGSTWLVIKHQLGPVPASWSVTYRFAIAGIAMFALAYVMERSLKMPRKVHLLAVVLGFLQFCVDFNFVYRAELYVTSGVVAVLFGLLLVPNALLARVFLGQPLTWRFVTGSAIGIVGIGLLLTHEMRSAPAGSNVVLGIAFSLAAILSVSFANVMQASKTARDTPVTVLLAWALLWGTLANVVVAYATSGPPVFPQDGPYWAGVFYLAIIASVATFPLYFKLCRDLGPGRAAYNGVVVPIVAMALSTVFEGFVWSGLAIAGGVLALAGMVLALRGRAAPVSTNPAEKRDV